MCVKLSKRVRLIHELGQRRGTEEFLDSRNNGTNIDEGLRRKIVEILRLQRHTLTNDALQTGETDAELILQQLADGTNAAVAQVIDIVEIAEPTARQFM